MTQIIIKKEQKVTDTAKKKRLKKTGHKNT